MGLGYIKDPCVPQTLWFLGICVPLKTNSNYSRKGSLDSDLMYCRKGGGRGWVSWGLQIRRGVSSLRRKTGIFFHVKCISVLWQGTYHFFLWRYLRVFLIAIVKSPSPPFLLGFPFLLLVNLFEILLSLLYSLTLIFTDSNSLFSALNPKFLSF